jgi:hypothetical protein
MQVKTKFSIIALFGALSFIFNPATVLARTYQAQTGTAQTLMLELFTSEGCSSCPPADRWLSKLKNDKRLWNDIFPVAFHVDYWNYIGWTDPYSNERYSNRQRKHASVGNVASVYTPGFIVNGKEWRSWFRQRDIDALFRQNKAQPGKLSLKLQDEKLSAEFNPSQTYQEPLILNVAWLSMDLQTEVLNGENGGKTLQHNFVCRNWQKLDSRKIKGQLTWRKIMDKAQVEKADAVVVWVSTENNPKPIQTTGLKLK